MRQKLTEHFSSIFGSTFTWFAVVATWQEQLEWGLRIVGLLLAVLVSLLTIRSLLKKDGQPK